MRRALLPICAAGAVAAALAAHAAPRVFPGGTPLLSPSAVNVGQTITATNTPAGAACQWLRNGSAISGATTCGSYTTVTADGGTTVSEQVTFGSVTVASSGVPVGSLNFTQAGNPRAAILFH